MLQKIPSQDLNFNIELDIEDSKRAFLDAAKEYDRLMGK
jgi:hypothetical protein